MRTYAFFLVSLTALLANGQVEEQAEITQAAVEERNGFVQEAEVLRDQLDDLLKSRLAAKREKMKLGIRKANVYTNEVLDYLKSYLNFDSSGGGRKKRGGEKGADTIEGLADLKVELQDNIKEVKDTEFEVQEELDEKLSSASELEATIGSAKDQWDDLELSIAQGAAGAAGGKKKRR